MKNCLNFWKEGKGMLLIKNSKWEGSGEREIGVNARNNEWKEKCLFDWIRR